MYVYSVSPCHAQRRGFKNLRWERGRVGEWASGRVGEWACVSVATSQMEQWLKQELVMNIQELLSQLQPDFKKQWICDCWLVEAGSMCLQAATWIRFWQASFHFPSKVDAASAPNLGKSCDWQCERSCMSMKQTSKADVKSDSSGCSDIFIKARRWSNR